MPLRDKDSNFYRPRLALFSIVGLVLLAGLWLWLTAFPLNGAPQRFKVAFHQVNGLHKNSAVYIDGVRVGTIEDVVLKGPRTVVVSAMVNQHDVVVPAGSRFFIRANGLVGAK
jgi:ABC-type transporter Mla subunit MlaD